MEVDDPIEEAVNFGNIEAIIDLSKNIDSAKAYSPSLKRSASQVKVAEADLEKKQAMLMPKASVVWQRIDGDYLVSNVNNDQRLMLRFEFAPGAGASAITAIRGATEHREALQTEYEAVELELTNKIASLQENLMAIKLSLKEVESTLQSAQEVQRSFERQFLAGRRSWLEVMNAVREVDEAQRNLAYFQSNMLMYERKLRLYTGQFFAE